MFYWFKIAIGTLRSVLRTHRGLALENLALRQQVAVLKHRHPRPRLTSIDRVCFGWSYRGSGLIGEQVCTSCNLRLWCGGIGRGFDITGGGRSHRRGHPVIDHEVRALIRQMSLANPLWGAAILAANWTVFRLTPESRTAAEPDAGFLNPDSP